MKNGNRILKTVSGKSYIIRQKEYRLASVFPNFCNSPSQQLLRWRSVAHVQATGHRCATNRFLMPGAIPRNMKMAGLLQ